MKPKPPTPAQEKPHFGRLLLALLLALAIIMLVIFASEAYYAQLELG